MTTPNNIVEIYQPTGDKLDVSIQDQTTPDISLFLGQSLATDLTFTSTPAVDGETAVLITSPTVVPIVGNDIFIREGTYFSQLELNAVTDLTGGNYSVDLSMPLDYVYTTSATITLQNVDLSVNGSVTPIEFCLTAAGQTATEEWDINRMIVSMTHTASGDDGKFGGITALTNGIYFRYEDGTTKNLFNAKENADFAAEGYDITYPARSGGLGTYGTRARITFNGQDKRGVVIRLAAATADKFVGIVRDDLSTLTSFRVKVQGQVVEP